VPSEGSDPFAGPVASWLRGQGVPVVEPLRAELIQGGRSNLTYALVDATGARRVLRRPPMGHVLATAHDMGREWRFISALAATPVAVPAPIASCADAGVIGAPFFVMEFVDGAVLTVLAAARALTRAARERAGIAMVETLAALHSVDVEAVGLGDIGPRADFVARQLRRWQRQWEQTKPGDVAAMDALHRRLEDAVPPQQRDTVVHGDFRLGNLMIDGEGEVAAVLDWELAALGDPLADLGWTVMWWDDVVDTGAGTSLAGVDGFAPTSTLVERYAAATGLDVAALPYYVAFNVWRRLCIRAGVAARFAAGVMGDQERETPVDPREEIEQGAAVAMALLDGAHDRRWMR
jgi:aminoglycoside phosphotransferase (APT) family kinase protein